MFNTDPEKVNIFVVIEDLKLQDFVALILIGEGYSVKTFSRHQDALKELDNSPADLIIVDFLSPNVRGLELCKAIREHYLFRYTPLLLMIPQNAPLMKTKTIYTGADDFIEKPFSSEELLARTKASLWRAHLYHDMNPLTKLPGMSTAIRELNSRIASRKLLGVAYADLFHFGRYNERYGFTKGDELLKNTATLIRQTILDLGVISDFLAHFGEDDFLFITSVESMEPICERIIKNFDENIKSFYNEEDINQGFVRIKNRKGEVFEAPLLRIHIGSVTNVDYPFVSSAQVFQIVIELKNYAKKFEKSMCVKERRKTYPFY